MNTFLSRLFQTSNRIKLDAQILMEIHGRIFNERPGERRKKNHTRNNELYTHFFALTSTTLLSSLQLFSTNIYIHTCTVYAHLIVQEPNIHKGQTMESNGIKTNKTRKKSFRTRFYFHSISIHLFLLLQIPGDEFYGLQI